MGERASNESEGQKEEVIREREKEVRDWEFRKRGRVREEQWDIQRERRNNKEK